MTGTKSSDDLLHFPSKVVYNRLSQEAWRKTGRSHISVDSLISIPRAYYIVLCYRSATGKSKNATKREKRGRLLLLLKVQLLQCGYDRKKSHWNYMRVYAAPARTRGNGGNFHITQAAGRRAAIPSVDASKGRHLLKSHGSTTGS
ncbi:hypothetical protein D6C89_03069 [Aureobasidium pullulans]|nr:hypothetical protein D6C89_03069 [Aureobasidium pullulans]